MVNRKVLLKNSKRKPPINGKEIPSIWVQDGSHQTGLVPSSLTVMIGFTTQGSVGLMWSQMEKMEFGFGLNILIGNGRNPALGLSFFATKLEIGCTS